MAVQVVLHQRTLYASVSPRPPLKPLNITSSGRVVTQAETHITLGARENVTLGTYTLDIYVYVSKNPIDTYKSPPPAPQPVVYSNSTPATPSEWQLCGKIGFGTLRRSPGFWIPQTSTSPLLPPTTHNTRSTPRTHAKAAKRTTMLLAAAGAGVVAVAVVAVAVAAGRRGR